VNYPDEADFGETPFEPTDFEGPSDIDEFYFWFEEHRDTLTDHPLTEFWDWVLEFLGIRMDTTFLWNGHPYVVTDERSFGHELAVHDCSTNRDREITDLPRFFLDWTDGDVVPAVSTGRWVERRASKHRTYGLFAGNPQDPNEVYLLYGGPVTVDTRDCTDAEITDAVVTKVIEQYDITFDLPPEEELFLGKLSEFHD